jgi:hypothetical protein
MIKRFFIIATVALASLFASAQRTDAADRKLRFTWGAELVGNVDLSHHDMSSVGINAEFGFEKSWVRFLGVAAEADVMVSNSSRAFPIALVFRTDFSHTRRLLFLDLRGGAVLNYPSVFSQSTNGYASGGIGVTLATGKTFSSHLIVAYSYFGQDQCSNGIYVRHCPGYSYATLRLGLQF